MKDYYLFRTILLAVLILNFSKIAMSQNYEEAAKNYFVEHNAENVNLLKTAVEKNGSQDLIFSYNKHLKEIKRLLDEASKEIAAIEENFNKKYSEVGEDCQSLILNNKKMDGINRRMKQLNFNYHLAEASYKLCMNNVNRTTNCENQKNNYVKLVKLYNKTLNESKQNERQGKIYLEGCNKRNAQAEKDKEIAEAKEYEVEKKYENLLIPHREEYNKIHSDLVKIVRAESDMQRRIADQEKNKLKRQKSIDGSKNYFEGVDLSKVDPIPFAIVEERPIFPGCGEETDYGLCTSDKIKAFAEDNFNYSIVSGLDLSSGNKRVYSIFVIDREGRAVDFRARGPHRALETELIRVLSTLPQMKPAVQNGVIVPVKYILPFTLIVE